MMKTKYLLFYILSVTILCYSHNCFSQKAQPIQDSVKNLKEILKRENSPNKIDSTKMCIAELYYKLQEYDSALLYTQNLPYKSPETQFLKNKLIGDVYLIRDQSYYTSLSHYYKAKSLLPNNVGQKKKYELMYNIGLVHQELRNYDSAKVYFNTSREIGFGLANSEFIKAEIFNQLGRTYATEENYQKAKELIDSANQFINKNSVLDDNHYLLESMIYGSYSYFYERQGYLDSSFYFLLKEVETLEKMVNVNNITLARAYSNASYEYLNQGLVGQAKLYAQKSINLYESTVGENYKSLGYAYLRKANALALKPSALNESLRLSLEALRIYENAFGKDHIETAYPKHEVGRAYNRLGEYAKALIYHETALEISLANNRLQNRVESYFSTGETLVKLNQFNKAKDYLITGKQLITNALGPNHIYNSYYAKALAELEYKTGNHKGTEFFFKQAEEVLLLNFGHSHPELAELYYTMALYNYELENNELAINYLTTAEKANQETYLTNGKTTVASETILVDINNLHSKLLLRKFNESKNIQVLESAKNILYKNVSILLQLLNSGEHQRDLIHYSETYNETFGEILKVLSKLHSINGSEKLVEELFLMSEKSRAILLGAESNYQAPLEDDLEKRKLENQLFMLKTLRLNVNRVDTLERQRLEQRIFSTTNQLRKYPKRHLALLEETSLQDIKGIQNQLDDNETVIEYSFHEDRLYIFVLSPKSISYKQVTVKNLPALIRESNKQYSEKDIASYIQVQSDLYKVLIHPVKQFITTNGIIVVPDRELWELNFDLLIENEQSTQKGFKALDYLIKKHNISYTYSLVHTFKGRVEKISAPKEVLGFAFNRKTQSFMDRKDSRTKSLTGLPGSSSELNKISQFVNGDFHYGALASEDLFKAQAANYRILHLAIHGKSDSTDYENSRLFFAQNLSNKTEDGTLYTFELENMKLNADLAVLTACETGNGELHVGEGILSMGRAFHKAGVNSLLLSRGLVSDAIAPEIITDFYENLKKGLKKDEALKQAKINFLINSNNISSNPYYWGNFFILGDNAPIKFQDSKKNLTNLLCLLIALTVLCLIARKVKTKSLSK